MLQAVQIQFQQVQIVYRRKKYQKIQSQIGNSITAYETSQTQKSAYRYALEQDAQHIKTLGKTFEQVDQSIANILTAGLLGD